MVPDDPGGNPVPGGGRRWLESGALRGVEADAALRARAAAGIDVDAEADTVASWGPHSVLDAGCGTGRVAIALAAQGIDVVGVDVDPAMLAVARRRAPMLTWVEADLAALDLRETARARRRRRFDVVVSAGNVMVHLDPGSEATVLRRLAGHLRPGGRLAAAFHLLPGRDEMTVERYDVLARAAGLVPEERWADWAGTAWSPAAGHTVLVHRRRVPA